MNLFRYSKILVVVLFLGGCAAPSQIMVYPSTWQQMDCSTWGFGWLGTPIALSSYQECINKAKAMGYVPIEQAEANEPAKLMGPTTSSPSQMRPIWVENSEWEYSVTGSANTKKHFIRVLKKDIFQKQTGYIALNQEGKHIFYNESIGIGAILNKGVVEKEYTPPLRPFDWPLSVGKSWKATGIMKTANGKLNLATCYEVKGYGKVKVPAGTFDAFYIIGKNDTQRVRIVELWYSPEAQNYVKSAIYLVGGKVTEELNSYSLGKEDSAQKGDDIEKKLEKLKGLLNKGLITQDEYNGKKTELLEKF